MVYFSLVHICFYTFGRGRDVMTTQQVLLHLLCHMPFDIIIVGRVESGVRDEHLGHGAGQEAAAIPRGVIRIVAVVHWRIAPEGSRSQIAACNADREPAVDSFLIVSYSNNAAWMLSIWNEKVFLSKH